MGLISIAHHRPPSASETILQLPETSRREKRSISVEPDSQNAEKPSEKGAYEFARRELFGPEGLGSFRGLTRKADIVRIAEAVKVSPGVAVEEMYRKHMLSHEWRSDLLVDVEIPIAVWAVPGRRRLDAALRYRKDHPRSRTGVQAYTCHPHERRRRKSWPRFIWTPPK